MYSMLCIPDSHQGRKKLLYMLVSDWHTRYADTYKASSLEVVPHIKSVIWKVTEREKRQISRWGPGTCGTYPD